MVVITKMQIYCIFRVIATKMSYFFKKKPYAAREREVRLSR
jgi:hypothetical protein